MEPNHPHTKEPSSTRYAVLGVAAGLSVLAAGAAAGGVMARVATADAPDASTSTPAVTGTDTATYQTETEDDDDYYSADEDDDDDDEGSVYTDTRDLPSAPSFSGTFDAPATSSRQS